MCPAHFATGRAHNPRPRALDSWLPAEPRSDPVRILFTTHTPPSHFFPLQPIAHAARAAGHEVAVATGSSLADTIKRAGFVHFEAGTNMQDPAVGAVFDRVRDVGASTQPAFAMTEVFGGVLVERMLPDLLRVCDAFQPDCVVSEVTEPTGLLVAEARGLPSACVPFGLLTAIDVFRGERGSEQLAVHRARLGLERGAPAQCYERAFTMVFAPRSYQPHTAKLPQHTRFYRPTASAQEAPLPAWLREPSDRPIVYGTLGTVPHFNGVPGALRAVIDALGASDVQGVVTCGHNQDPASFAPLPANVRVERFIPQAALLPKCSALIGHGGYGTTIGAMSFGVPMVLTPLGADQPLHAERCRELGIAEVVTRDRLSADSIHQALEKVLHAPSYRQNAQRVLHELTAQPDATQALHDLAAFAADGGERR